MDNPNDMTQHVNGTVWLVIKTKPRQEERAKQNLEQQGFSVYLPRLGVSKRLRGQWRKVVEPLFPGYLFLYIDPLEISLSPVRSTFGVSNLVRFGHQLVPVPETVIDFLRLREQKAEDGGNDDISPFAPGDAVQVMDGPFAGLPAVFQMAKGQDRALLLISLLGRANGIMVPLDQIAPTG